MRENSSIDSSIAKHRLLALCKTTKRVIILRLHTFLLWHHISDPAVISTHAWGQNIYTRERTVHSAKSVRKANMFSGGENTGKSFIMNFLTQGITDISWLFRRYIRHCHQNSHRMNSLNSRISMYLCRSISQERTISHLLVRVWQIEVSSICISIFSLEDSSENFSGKCSSFRDFLFRKNS